MNRTEFTRSKNSKNIRISLSDEQHQNLLERAAEQHSTLKDYTKNKLLDDTLGVKLLSDRIMQLMPRFYNLVSEIDNPNIRKELADFGGTICRYLK